MKLASRYNAVKLKMLVRRAKYEQYQKVLTQKEEVMDLLPKNINLKPDVKVEESTTQNDQED